MKELFDIQLGCVNCGLAKFYKLPYRSEFFNYEDSTQTDSGEREYSFISTGLNRSGQHIPINCDNCGYAFLYRKDWDESQLVTSEPDTDATATAN